MDERGNELNKEYSLRDFLTDSGLRRGPVDIPFLLLVLILLAIGVVMLLSASYARAYYAGKSPTYYFSRQFIFALLGLVAMFVCSRIPMGFYRRYQGLVMFVALGLLALVIPVGVLVNGSKRWVQIAGIQFQPSEIAKIAVILTFSSWICRYKGAMKTIKYGIAPFAGVLLLISILLICEPHLSATIIIILVGGTLMFLGGVKLYWFIAAGGLGFLALELYLKFFGYASERIKVWRDPLSDTSNTAYQITQSLYSIGSGGVTGVGLGMSRQKYLYLPEEHNDFIFSIICEELGFIGALVILLLFSLLIIRGYWLAMHSKDRFSFLVCCGIITLFAIQITFNVAVVTNTIPCTGVSLPFFSSGGTALVLQLAEMGIVLSATRDIPAKKERIATETLEED